MPLAQSALTTAPLLADGFLALGCLCAALIVFARRDSSPSSRPLAGLLSAAALASAAHALAPLLGEPIASVALVLAAILAGCGVVALWRFVPAPPVPAPAPAHLPTCELPFAEEATSRLLDAALAACRDGVVIVATNDLTGVQIVYSNAAFAHLTGYSNHEAVGLSPSVLVDEDGLTAVRSALRGTEPVRAEVPGRRKDGSRVRAEWQVVPIIDAGGRHTHSVAILRDITERHHTEQALRESEARFRGLFDQAADGILVLDPRGKIVDANPQVCRTLGYQRDELTALGMVDLDTGPNSASVGAATAESDAMEHALQCKDGRLISAEIRHAVTEYAGRRMTLVMIRDVTRRRSAEQALRDREQLLRSIIAHIPCGVFWKDRKSVYLGCNEQVARDHGLSAPDQVVGRSDNDFTTDPTEAERYRDCDRAVMDSGQPLLNLEESQTRPDGTRATILTSKVPLRNTRGRVIGVLGVYADITDRKRLEDQLRHAQKMDAVGRLAGGIAHDFNNLLTIIRGNAELQRLSSDDTNAGLLDDIILASDRATALVRQLLMFSRRQPTCVEVLDLSEVVTALSGLLRRLLGEKVTLGFTPAAEPATVRADRAHLEQVVMNLAVNARDAMPTGGVLTVRTEAVERDAGRFVRLILTDTGSGMTEEVKARIFEPFFTTKGPDKGTGLGLATVFGIVQQAGGTIEVESAPGVGTTFRVDLPWWNGAARLTPTPIPRSATRRVTARPLSVLLVEDQDAVRRFASLALQGEGHQVSEAESGESALELAATDEHFDVLVTDVTMPGMDGQELAERVRVLRPDVGVVLMSGYAAASDGAPIPRSVFLQKPFAPADLLAALNRALRLVGRKQEPVESTWEKGESRIAAG